MTVPSDNEYFVRYFHGRAALAEELDDRHFRIDASIIAATALDALAEVWLHDFPDERVAMERQLGGKVPPSIRMARLVKRFGAGAPHVGKVAVVLFAEDWKRNVAHAASDAEALLASRRPQLPGQLPHAHLDIPAEGLLLECPTLSVEPLLVALVEEYEYPALLLRPSWNLSAPLPPGSGGAGGAPRRPSWPLGRYADGARAVLGRGEGGGGAGGEGSALRCWGGAGALAVRCPCAH